MSRTIIPTALAIAIIGGILVWLSGERFSPEDVARNTPNTGWLQEAAQGEMTKLLPAENPDPAPDRPFFDAAGKEFSLADFKGKVVLVNFWATWCAPCRAEMPSLERLHKALGGDGFTVIAVSIDRGGADAAQPFLDEIGVTVLPVFYDPKGALSRAWGVYGLPVTVLMDADGREIARMVGPAEWDSEDAKAVIRAAIGR